MHARTWRSCLLTPIFEWLAFSCWSPSLNGKSAICKVRGPSCLPRTFLSMTGLPKALHNCRSKPMLHALQAENHTQTLHASFLVCTRRYLDHGLCHACKCLSFGTCMGSVGKCFSFIGHFTFASCNCWRVLLLAGPLWQLQGSRST